MKNKYLILILNHTWGIIMTLIGYIARIVLVCMGVKGRDAGVARIYTVGRNWGGISLGTTIILSKTSSNMFSIYHETGHTIQNAVFGVLFPFLIGIPSLIRCQYYNYLNRRGKFPKRSYYAIWFEKQASQWGCDYYDCIYIGG